MNESDRTRDAAAMSAMIKDEVIYDLLVSKVSEVAKEKIEAETTKARNRVALFLTAGLTLFLAALTGVATFGFTALNNTLTQNTKTQIESEAKEVLSEALTAELPRLRKELNDEVQRSIDQKVSEKVKSAEDAWIGLSLVSELKQRLEKFQLTFSESEMKNIIELMTTISKTNDKKSKSEIPEILEKFIDGLAVSGRIKNIFDLEVNFQSEMLNREGITWTMSTMLGREIVAFPVDPSGLSGGKMQRDWEFLVDKYHQYADAARKHNFPEVPIVFDLILACMNEQRDAVLTALAARSDNLLEGEFQFALTTAGELASEAWRLEPDAHSNRAKLRTRDCATKASGPGHSPRVRMLLEAMQGA